MAHKFKPIITRERVTDVKSVSLSCAIAQFQHFGRGQLVFGKGGPIDVGD